MQYVVGGHVGNVISELPISFENGYEIFAHNLSLINVLHINCREGDLTTFNPTFTKTKNEFEPLVTNADDKTNTFHKIKSKEPPYNASEPFCQVYRGNICNKFLENRYVFIQPPYTQKIIEERLSEAVLVVSQSK